MNVFLVLVLVALVVAVVILYLRMRAAEQARRPPAGDDPMRREPRGVDVRSLSPGAVVSFEGRDWVVRGTLAFEQDGFVWHEHHLDDATARRWLSVEDDEELELCLWEAVPAAGLEPGPATVEHDGVTYALDERGSASYRAQGTTGTPPAGRVEYADYEAGDRRLSFERYTGESWEVSLGRVVSPRELDVYPAPRDGR